MAARPRHHDGGAAGRRGVGGPPGSRGAGSVGRPARAAGRWRVARVALRGVGARPPREDVVGRSARGRRGRTSSAGRRVGPTRGGGCHAGRRGALGTDAGVAPRVPGESVAQNGDLGRRDGSGSGRWASRDGQVGLGECADSRAPRRGGGCEPLRQAGQGGWATRRAGWTKLEKRTISPPQPADALARSHRRCATANRRPGGWRAAVTERIGFSPSVWDSHEPSRAPGTGVVRGGVFDGQPGAPGRRRLHPTHARDDDGDAHGLVSVQDEP